jgi:hypothetical protein
VALVASLHAVITNVYKLTGMKFVFFVHF